MKKADDLERKIKDGLSELLDGKSKKTPEERAELRENLKLAMAWKKIAGDEQWGSGFSKGENNGAIDDDDGSA
jgi:hypothetical protein